jgi:hypothetical protein
MRRAFLLSLVTVTLLLPLGCMKRSKPDPVAEAPKVKPEDVQAKAELEVLRKAKAEADRKREAAEAALAKAEAEAKRKADEDAKRQDAADKEARDKAFEDAKRKASEDAKQKTIPPPSTPTVTKENYDKIKVPMLEKDVRALLGPSSGESTDGDFLYVTWKSKLGEPQHSTVIVVRFRNGYFNNHKTIVGP